MAAANNQGNPNERRVSVQFENRNDAVQGQAVRDNDDEPPVHVPVPQFVMDNFPLLTANEYFRKLYDYIANIYNGIRYSLLVDYILGWILVFVPLLNPAILFAQFWYWTVWKLIVKPIIAFWLKIASIFGFTALVTSIWKKTLNLIDICANYIITTLGDIYGYVKRGWNQILADYNVVILQIAAQSKEMLQTFVRLMKIIYSYAEHVANLILTEKAEKTIVWIAKKVYSVAKWLYHMNKVYQETLDTAIKIIIKTWNENPKAHDGSGSSSGGVKSSGGPLFSTPRGQFEAVTGELHH